MRKRIYCLFLPFLLLTGGVWAQSDTVNLLSLSLEELMNVEIVSASKKTESLFDAPLSASVITKEEIAKSGATSVMEALRLVPGLIVREQTNGGYDIHVRGLDNVPPNTSLSVSVSISLLVMIDNRPIYNYLQGGIFWATLPVDINDVERIEIIRGPSSTLYGPNAVSGVINIITRKVEDSGLNAQANAKIGSDNTKHASANLGYRFNDDLSAAISASYNLRGRDPTYYVTPQDTWYNSIDEMNLTSDPFFPAPDLNATYPHPDVALDKYTVNAYVNYRKNENIQVDLSMGRQDSETHLMFAENFYTNFSTMTSESNYADLKVKYHGLNAQFAIASGTENPSLGTAGNLYDFKVGDAFMEYELKLNNLSIKPGAAYRNIVYDYSVNPESAIAMLQGKNSLETYGISLRTDYRTQNEKFRLAGGVRFDRTTYPKKWFTSFQVAPTYKINENNLVRAVYSRAYRSTFIYDAHMYSELSYAMPDGSIYNLVFSGNRELRPIHSDMIELGYRSKPAENFHLDLEAYHTKTVDFVGAVTMASTVDMGPPMTITTPMKLMERPVSAKQIGMTASINYMFGPLQIKPFVTMQKTTLYDYSPWSYMPDAMPDFYMNDDPSTKNIYSGEGTKRDHKFTPKFYGGAFINYSVNSKLNVNVNSYWFSPQTFYHLDNLNAQYKMVNPDIGIGRIDKKVMINANISYSPIEKLTFSLTGKNIFNDESREYYISDLAGRRIIAGIAFAY